MKYKVLIINILNPYIYKRKPLIEINTRKRISTGIERYYKNASVFLT